MPTAMRKSRMPPAIRKASMLIPSFPRSHGPPRAKKKRTAPATITARRAIRACSALGRSPARARNAGAIPTGSTTTKRVRNARRASSITGQVLVRRSLHQERKLDRPGSYQAESPHAREIPTDLRRSRPRDPRRLVRRDPDRLEAPPLHPGLGRRGGRPDLRPVVEPVPRRLVQDAGRGEAGGPPGRSKGRAVSRGPGPGRGAAGPRSTGRTCASTRAPRRSSTRVTCAGLRSRATTMELRLE